MLEATTLPTVPQQMPSLLSRYLLSTTWYPSPVSKVYPIGVTCVRTPWDPCPGKRIKFSTATALMTSTTCYVLLYFFMYVHLYLIFHVFISVFMPAMPFSPVSLRSIFPFCYFFNWCISQKLRLSEFKCSINSIKRTWNMMNASPQLGPKRIWVICPMCHTNTYNTSI